jgi:hypothetical protein
LFAESLPLSYFAPVCWQCLAPAVRTAVRVPFRTTAFTAETTLTPAFNHGLQDFAVVYFELKYSSPKLNRQSVGEMILQK